MVLDTSRSLFPSRTVGTAVVVGASAALAVDGGSQRPLLEDAPAVATVKVLAPVSKISRRVQDDPCCSLSSLVEYRLMRDFEFVFDRVNVGEKAVAAVATAEKARK